MGVWVKLPVFALLCDFACFFVIFVILYGVRYAQFEDINFETSDKTTLTVKLKTERYEHLFFSQSANFAHFRLVFPLKTPFLGGKSTPLKNSAHYLPSRPPASPRFINQIVS